MKTILTRTLLIAMLATSISAFAKSEGAQSGNAATPTNVTQQESCTQTVNPTSRQDEQTSPEERQIEQQDKDWQHDLQGTYGG